MPLRDQLQHLATALRAGGESLLADRAEKAVAGSDKELEAFLLSNDLWGGAGSVADQAGGGGARTPHRRDIEAALVALGKEQLSAGKVNERTQTWVSSFEQWAKS